MRVEREGGAAGWLAGTLAALSVQEHKLSLGRSYGSIRVFFLTSCSWLPEDLFDESSP